MSDVSDPVPVLKRQLADALRSRFAPSGFGMTWMLGIDQPRESNLLCGRLERFSLQQLVRFVGRADGDVALNVTWKSPRLVLMKNGLAIRPPRRRGCFRPSASSAPNDEIRRR